MTPKELTTIHRDLCVNARLILEDKDHDYSPESDALATIKEAAEDVGISPQLWVLNEINKKVKRQINIVKNRDGNVKVTDEPLGNAVDIINYAVILEAVTQDIQSLNKVANRMCVECECSYPKDLTASLRCSIFHTPANPNECLYFINVN